MAKAPAGRTRPRPSRSMRDPLASDPMTNESDETRKRIPTPASGWAKSRSIAGTSEGTSSQTRPMQKRLA